MNESAYEIVIGLEVHVQLATQTKLFCRCSTRFGASPNTQTCPICIGMPGALPVMNREAFNLALKTALSLNLEIPQFTKWDRKNYFYPDLPKGYQISQFDLPMSQNGWLDISDPKGSFSNKRIGIIRAHLEDDAGKSIHDEVAGKSDSRIDLNRTGTPLLEIVSEPDLRSPLEAKIFLQELKLILKYLHVSDCNMQEGSLRVDANINLHIQDFEEKIATPIVEVKNMNSFRAVERALEFEALRQYEYWLETGQRIGDMPKQTRGWDDTDQITRPQRHKEESSDYRYFPDPDLVPVTTTNLQIEEARSSLGDLPASLRDKLQTIYGISMYDADVIIKQGPAVVEYFVQTADACGDGKLAGNWIQQSVMRFLKENELHIKQFPVSSNSLADLLKKVIGKEVDTSRARGILQEMIKTGKSADHSMKRLGIEKVDDSDLVALCHELLKSNPQIVEDIKSGKGKAAGAIIGQAKKQNPNINPGKVREICLQIVESM